MTDAEIMKEMGGFERSQDCIEYIMQEINKYYPIDKKKEITLGNILWKKDYEELYRLANAIDRFGLDIIMEVIHG